MWTTQNWKLSWITTTNKSDSATATSSGTTLHPAKSMTTTPNIKVKTPNRYRERSPTVGHRRRRALQYFSPQRHAPDRISHSSSVAISNSTRHRVKLSIVVTYAHPQQFFFNETFVVNVQYYTACIENRQLNRISRVNVNNSWYLPRVIFFSLQTKRSTVKYIEIAPLV